MSVNNYECLRCHNIFPKVNRFFHDLRCTENKPVPLNQSSISFFDQNKRQNNRDLRYNNQNNYNQNKSHRPQPTIGLRHETISHTSLFHNINETLMEISQNYTCWLCGETMPEKERSNHIKAHQMENEKVEFNRTQINSNQRQKEGFQRKIEPSTNFNQNNYLETEPENNSVFISSRRRLLPSNERAQSYFDINIRQENINREIDHNNERSESRNNNSSIRRDNLRINHNNESSELRNNNNSSIRRDNLRINHSYESSESRNNNNLSIRRYNRRINHSYESSESRNNTNSSIRTYNRRIEHDNESSESRNNTNNSIRRYNRRIDNDNESTESRNNTNNSIRAYNRRINHSYERTESRNNNNLSIRRYNQRIYHSYESSEPRNNNQRQNRNINERERSNNLRPLSQTNNNRRQVNNQLNRNHRRLNRNNSSRVNLINLPESKINKISSILDPENKSCRICLDDYNIGDLVTTLPCIHLYHSSCIKRWLKEKDYCPICRTKITRSNLG